MYPNGPGTKKHTEMQWTEWGMRQKWHGTLNKYIRITMIRDSKT